jgi:hypothetical protein
MLALPRQGLDEDRRRVECVCTIASTGQMTFSEWLGERFDHLGDRRFIAFVQVLHTSNLATFEFSCARTN